MTMITWTMPKDFNWNSEDGELTNLLLNMMGGLQYKDLSKEEQEMLAKHGYIEEKFK